MRYNLNDQDIPLRAARRLRDFLDSPDFGLSRCQNLVARMFGYRDLHDLQSCLTGPGGFFGPDDYWFGFTVHDVANRRWRQVLILGEAGVPPARAVRAIAELHPTAHVPKGWDFKRKERWLSRVTAVPAPWNATFGQTGFEPDHRAAARHGPDGRPHRDRGRHGGRARRRWPTRPLREVHDRRPDAKVMAVDVLDHDIAGVTMQAVVAGCLAVAPVFGDDVGGAYHELARAGVPAAFLREHLLGIFVVSSRGRPGVVPVHAPVPFDGGLHPSAHRTMDARVVDEAVYVDAGGRRAFVEADVAEGSLHHDRARGWPVSRSSWMLG